MSDESQTLPLAADFPPATREQWLALVGKVVSGPDPEARLTSRTPEGLEIRPLYTRTEAPSFTDWKGPAARPRSSGRAAAWDVRQIHADADPARANTAVREDLAGGASSLLIRFASPGVNGIELRQSVLSQVLKDVRLDACFIGLRAGPHFEDAARHLSALWSVQGLSDDQRRGAFDADPLGTLAATGTLPSPIEASLRAAAGLARDSAGLPNVTVLLADGHVYHAAGAGEAQELAAIAATVVAYLRAGEAAGLSPEQTLPKIAVNLAVDADQFLSIAKLRAARRVIGRLAEVCGAAAVSDRVRFSAETATRMMARRDPWVNMLRTTIACASAAMGGADAITVLPYTWALGQPDSFARRIARNTHLVLMEESGLGRVTDPAGGGWYAERITEDLAQKAWELFQAIEAKGGMVAALTSGFLQEEIARVAAARSERIARGQDELTGVSAYPQLESDGVEPEPWPAPPAIAGPGLIAPLAPCRLAQPFEALRDKADAYTSRGSRPRVFLAALGDAVDHGTRSMWARNFLASGGIEAVASEGFANSADAGKAFAESGASVACICSSDAVYGQLGEASAMALKGAGAKFVYAAGKPGVLEGALRAAGVDGFWFAGQNRIGALETLQQELGIS